MDIPASTRIPALSTDEVAPVSGPPHVVVAAIAVVVGDVSLAISPEGIVEAVVMSSGAGSSTTGGKQVGRLAGRDISWECESTGSGRNGEEERGEGDHVDDLLLTN